jgi:aminoglycoside phosphotransferase (APT) family kinase protein
MKVEWANEILTTETVTRLLRDNLDPALECVAVVRGPGGNAQETWFVDAQEPAGGIRRLVIRRSAESGTLEHTDRQREYGVLRLLAGLGFPVPAVHWLETEPSALGQPYLVMDRLPGATPLRPSPTEREAIARQIGTWLARLHGLDLEGVPPELARPADTADATASEVRLWRREYLRRRPGPVPMLGALLAWLEANPPDAAAPVRLLWGDPGPHNVLVEGDRVTALLDWELTHLGHPLDDLGAALWACLDTYDREQVIAGYEQMAGPVDRDELCYFEVLACVSRAIMVLSGVAAFLDERPSPSLAGLGQYLMLTSLARGAAAAGWGTPTSPQPAAPTVPPVLRLRPDVAETVDRVGRFLLDSVLPVTSDSLLRRELKVAATLLAQAADRTAREPALLAAREAALGQLPHGTGSDLEQAATQAEQERSPARERFRAHLLADLGTQLDLLGGLTNLYGARA